MRSLKTLIRNSFCNECLFNSNILLTVVWINQCTFIRAMFGDGVLVVSHGVHYFILRSNSCAPENSLLPGCLFFILAIVLLPFYHWKVFYQFWSLLPMHMSVCLAYIDFYSFIYRILH